MSGISLTASMRSNLLSLQNISGQVSSTQNKLSTGNKVNSAIDNPSSYYTALSLNNRADDLNALLDSMGQAVSTIKAATTALESATEFLEQAKAVANQALEQAIPSKEQLQNMVGENGAVVSTAQELKDAIAAGKETICVYGSIDLGDISTSGGLELKENQKLVGIGYFGNYDTDTDKFSSISAEATVPDKNLLTVKGNNATISDLSFNYKNSAEAGGYHAISINGDGKNNVCTLRNLDISTDFAASQNNSVRRGAIHSKNQAIIEIEGKININTSGRPSCGIFTEGSVANINNKARVTIQTSGDYGWSIFSQAQSTLNIAEGAELTSATTGGSGHGIVIEGHSSANIAGNLYLHQSEGNDFMTSTDAGNTVNILSSARLHLFSGGGFYPFYNAGASVAAPNTFKIAAGAKIASEVYAGVDWYTVTETYTDINTSSNTNLIFNGGIQNKIKVETSAPWELPVKIGDDEEQDSAIQDLANANKNYQEILNQYDSLIKDASYKGINLLRTDKLTVKFNEENTAALEVIGKDMSSQALGFKTFDWQTQEDINKSVEELSAAVENIRNYSSELGNNYNIITTRQDFTESLINVLTEGADKLTLADMNEESANMLALQTRQQLAINSLSLASQASQSILKLF